MSAVVILKNHKNHDISVTVWPIFMKFGMLMQNVSLNRADHWKIRISQIQDGARPLFWKTVKSPYLCNRLTDFDEIWHNDAYAPPHQIDRLNFQFLKIQDGGGRHLQKSQKIAISPQRFHRSLRNSVHWCKMGLLTARAVKKFEFHNPTWRTAAILKTVKSPYLDCNRLTDFDEIWHGDAYCPPTAGRPLKFPIFENPRWQRPPSWKITKKLRYLLNDLTDLYEIWYADAKWVS